MAVNPSSTGDVTLKTATQLSLRTNFSWTFVGNVIYAGCQWGMLVVLAKVGSPEMVGQFALGLEVTAPIIMFTNLQLRGVQATDARQEYSFKDYLGLRLASSLLALVVILGIALLAGYSREAALVILAVGAAKVVESISDVFYGLLQQHERMDRIAKSMMLKGPLSLVALSLGVLLTGSVFFGVIGLVAAWTAVLLVYDIRSGALILKSSHQAESTLVHSPAWSELSPRWNLNTLARLAWLALPLGLVMMLISLNTNIPRYFIEGYLGERELGIFTALAYLNVAGGLIVGALGQSASPRLSKYYVLRNKTAFQTLLLKLLGLGVLLGGIAILVALIAGREILTLLYKAEYAEHTSVFIWLMFSGGYAMTASHNFKIQPLIYAVSVATTALLCAVLVPRHGLLGAAWATTITGFVQMNLVFICNMHAIQRMKSNAIETAKES